MLLIAAPSICKLRSVCSTDPPKQLYTLGSSSNENNSGCPLPLPTTASLQLTELEIFAFSAKAGHIFSSIDMPDFEANYHLLVVAPQNFAALFKRIVAPFSLVDKTWRWISSPGQKNSRKMVTSKEKRRHLPVHPKSRTRKKGPEIRREGT